MYDDDDDEYQPRVNKIEQPLKFRQNVASTIKNWYQVTNTISQQQGKIRNVEAPLRVINKYFKQTQ